MTTPVAHIRTHSLPYGETGEGFVALGLVKDVSNSDWLRSQVSAGQIQAALLNPTLLCGEFHVLVAVNKAVTRFADNQMKTKTVYSEIIYSLSPSTNISESFKKFGIQDHSTSVLVVILTPDRDNSKVERVLGMIQGVTVPLDDISLINDEAAIRKVYKVPDAECAISTLENSIATRISTRDVL